MSGVMPSRWDDCVWEKTTDPEICVGWQAAYAKRSSDPTGYGHVDCNIEVFTRNLGRKQWDEWAGESHCISLH